MLSVEPTGAILGATIHGVDVKRIDEREFAQVLLALGQHGVLRFPEQQLDIGDGFTDSNAPPIPGPDEQVPDVIRDRIPVAYKGNSYFEILGHVSTRPMEKL